MKYVENNMRRFFLMLMMFGLWSGGANAYLLHKYIYGCAPVSKVYTKEEIEHEFKNNSKVNIYPDFMADGAVVEAYHLKGMNSGSDIVYVPPQFRSQIKEGFFILVASESFREFFIAKNRVIVMDIIDNGDNKDKFWRSVPLITATTCNEEILNSKGWFNEDRYKNEDVIWQKR